MGECPNSFETEGIPKSQWAEGVGGFGAGSGDGGCRGEASVGVGVKKTLIILVVFTPLAPLSKNQKGYVSCVSLQFGVPSRSEDKAAFYIRGVPNHFR